MNIAIVIVTYNRLEYTKKCISRLLEDTTEEFDLYLWDNASVDETPEYLRALKDARIVEVVLNKENMGQTGAMNYVWSKTKAELVGKLDNDCLVTPGWTRTLAHAHEDIARLGAVACWHYPLEELNERAARRANKIHSFNGHQILRHPWVCGSGFIMKHSTYTQYGRWRAGIDVGTTEYFLNMALGGEINGWYFPPIYQEHMDDPKSIHSMVTNDEDVHKWYDVTYTLRTKKITNMRERWERRDVVLANLNSGPWEAKYYVGWRKRLRSVIDKFLKISS
jgi:glycosyltransferase involved in cell wall biosynthesis